MREAEKGEHRREWNLAKGSSDEARFGDCLKNSHDECQIGKSLKEAERVGRLCTYLKHCNDNIYRFNLAHVCIETLIWR